MSLTSTITQAFRILQLIPLILVFIPIFASYWQRKNKINGLRRIRVTLLVLLGSLIFSNIYFIFFSIFSVSRTTSMGIFFLSIEKVVNLAAYILLYLLFKHASNHNDALIDVKKPKKE